MIDIGINFKTSIPQREMFSQKEKYVTVTKGRRLGATQGGAQKFIKFAAVDKIPHMLWGDTIQSNINKYFDRYFYPILKQGIDFHYHRTEKTLKIYETIIDFRSAEKPYNWEGFGYHKIFLNEAGIILANDYLYDNAVLPMMLDFPQSQLIAAGVPKGKVNKLGLPHKFYSLYEKAKMGEPNHKLLEYSSYDSPFLRTRDIEELELQFASGLMRDQEIYGKFVDATDRPFFYSFEREKYVKEFELNPMLPLIYSFDFNKEPMTCIVGQRMNAFIIAVRYANKIDIGSTPEMCEMLHAQNTTWGRNLFITGDATGRNRTPLERGEVNHYLKIKSYFNLSDSRFNVRKANPSHINSRLLCNSVMQNMNVMIHPDCEGLINDIIYANVDQQGEIIKSQILGRHFFDCFRYLLDSEFPDFLKNPRRYIKMKVA
ncbi:MAG TPA: hypothetical protein ENH82_02140 [bacterium]|nr:hypothetical protein [bacterium]